MTEGEYSARYLSPMKRLRITGKFAIAAVFFLSIWLWCQAVFAMGIPTENGNLSIRWDNTLKYSNMFRLLSPSSKIVDDIAAANQDDGDRNFSDTGMVSNRVDLLSEFDVKYKNLGFRASGAAWYDTTYNRTNHNDSPFTTNQLSVAPNEFTDDTRDLQGRKVELLDLLATWRFRTGREGSVNIRAGRFAQLWGETLFFGTNGIAGAMASVDINKAVSVPGSTFKEIIRPVGQVSVDYQVNRYLSFSAYSQVEWEEHRLPGVGSFFSIQDLFIEGGERFLTPIGYFRRGNDMEASDEGQFGLQARFSFPFDPTTQYGLYVVRYNEKSPQIYFRFNGQIPGDPLTDIGEYLLAYPENIWALGISASHNIGDVNLATEISYRTHAPLVSDGQFLFAEADNDDHPAYAIGKSFHANLSAVWTMPRNPLFAEGLFMGEIAYNRRLSIDKNSLALTPASTKDAVAFRVLMTPTYRQVMTGLDLDVPIGLGYSPKGTSSTVGQFNNYGMTEGGDVSVGLDFTYQYVWKLNLKYGHFFGSAGPALNVEGHFTFKNPYGDRDFISMEIGHTF